MTKITGTKGFYHYNLQTYDSKEEIWFAWYLDELNAAGYIDFYRYQPSLFELSDSVKYPVDIQLKTKIKTVYKTLLQPHSYQCDFKIVWSAAAKNVFFTANGNKKDFPFIARDVLDLEFRSHVDIKPAHDLYNMTREFIINQKWVYQVHGVYVQKIVPAKLFKSTFTPERYYFTDKSLKPRKLAFQPVCLKAFKGKRS